MDHEIKARCALNPIFEYAANGQCSERNGSWKEAVDWYHRSLACLPNHYGPDKKIRQCNSNSARTVAFTPRHAARIYSALGRCLMALDRSQDSLLAFGAARRLDPADVSIRRFIRAHSNDLKGDGIEAGSSIDADGSKPNATAVDLSKSLSLIMVTHCTDRLQKFEALSPPSCKLITATYGSLLKVFGEDISACPRIMCYDRKSVSSAPDSQYAKSVEKFCREQGFEFRTFPGVGLFNVLNRVAPSITTPYIFFVEHDWLFQGDPIRLNVIVEMMNKNPNLHSVRFNKRDNQINGHDFIMEVEGAQEGYAMLRTSSYSNNPSIIRTEKLKNEWLPKCHQALQLVSENLGGSAFGIEEILFKSHVRDIRKEGFGRAHTTWGACVFGPAGAQPRLVHLGE